MRKMIFRVMNGCVVCVVFTVLSLCYVHVSSAYEKEIKALSATMAENITKAGKNRIAVVDFTDLQGNVTELGRFLAEEFSVALLGAGQGFELVDRTHLQSLLKEHKLSTTGLIDPATARQLGQIAGVDALVTGTITPFGESVRLSVKILDASTAKLIGATAGEIPKTKAIEELLGRGITTEEKTSTEPIEPKTPKPPVKAQQTVETQGFTFALQECKRSGKNVICSVLITSKDEDQKLRLYCKASISDDLGNLYNTQGPQLGGKSCKGSWRIEDTFFANIPKVVILPFEGVSSEVTMITMLGINLNSNKGDFGVQFLNIPLAK
jgi:TolB-like protein